MTTHNGMKLQRQKIAEYVADGHSPAQAAKKFKRSLASVHCSCREFGVPNQLRAEQALLRAKIAAYVCEGHTGNDAVKHFKTNYSLVHRACLEFGLEPARKEYIRPRSKQSIDRMKKLIDMKSAGATLDDMSRQFLITRERARQLINIAKHKYGMVAGKNYLTLDDAAKEISVCRGAIYNKMKLLGFIKDIKDGHTRRGRITITSDQLEAVKVELDKPRHGWAVGTTNKPWGRLTVIEYIKGGTLRCQCTCGKECKVSSSNFRRTKSCGCAMKEYCLKMIHDAKAKNGTWF